MLKIFSEKQALIFFITSLFTFNGGVAEAYPEIDTEDEVLEKIDHEFGAILDKIEDSKKEILLQQEINDKSRQNSERNSQNQNRGRNSYGNNNNEQELAREKIRDLEYQLNNTIADLQENIEEMKECLGLNRNHNKSNAFNRSTSANNYRSTSSGSYRSYSANNYRLNSTNNYGSRSSAN